MSVVGGVRVNIVNSSDSVLTEGVVTEEGVGQVPVETSSVRSQLLTGRPRMRYPYRLSGHYWGIETHREHHQHRRRISVQQNLTFFYWCVITPLCQQIVLATIFYSFQPSTLYHYIILVSVGASFSDGGTPVRDGQTVS